MPYQELDPAIVLEAIKGHDNILDGEQRKADSFYRQFVCPACGSDALGKRFTPGHAFKSGSGWLLARATLVCDHCHCHFDPHSGLLLERGEPVVLID